MRTPFVGLLFVLAACQVSPPAIQSGSELQQTSIPAARPVSQITAQPAAPPGTVSATSPPAVIQPLKTTVPAVPMTVAPVATPQASSSPEIRVPEEGCRPLPSTGNLVRNPDFESPSVLKTGYQVTGQSFESWKIENGSVEIAASLWRPGSGAQSLDLDGSKQTGSVSQVMATQPGQAYQLSFCLAGNPDGQPRVKQLEVFWNNRSLAHLSFDTQGHDRVKMGWVTHRIEVPANWTASDLTQLRFVSRNPAGGSWGAVIDALAVQASP